MITVMGFADTGILFKIPTKIHLPSAFLKKFQPEMFENNKTKLPQNEIEGKDLFIICQLENRGADGSRILENCMVQIIA